MDLNDIEVPLDKTQLRVHLGTLMSIIEIIQLDKSMSMERLMTILMHNAREVLDEIKGCRSGLNERH